MKRVIVPVATMLVVQAMVSLSVLSLSVMMPNTVPTARPTIPALPTTKPRVLRPPPVARGPVAASCDDCAGGGTLQGNLRDLRRTIVDSAAGNVCALLQQP